MSVEKLPVRRIDAASAKERTIYLIVIKHESTESKWIGNAVVAVVSQGSPNGISRSNDAYQA